MRRLAAIGLACAVLLCAGAMWFAAPERVLAVPGAFDVRVVHTAPGTRVITFEIADTGGDWAYQLDRSLRARGWLPPDYSGAPAQFTIYSHVMSFGVGTLWEEADIQGNAHAARITVRRWLRLPWLTRGPIKL